MTIYDFLALVGKIIVAGLVLTLMIWLRWKRGKSRYEGDLKGYSPILKLDKDSTDSDEANRRKPGVVVEFRKEEHRQPINELEPLGRQKRKVRFSIKVSRNKTDE